MEQNKVSKDSPNCPKCHEEDIEFVDTCDDYGDEAEEHFSCNNCGCEFSVKIGRTIVYFYDTIKIIDEDGK